MISSNMSANSLCQQAELAEQWGYDSFWLPESHFSGMPSIPDPMLLLAAVAARTSTIKLGTTSYLLPIRNALQAAEQVAVLDQLSEGRVILGLGRGFQAGMLDAFGVKPSEKRQRFEQILGTMKKAWAGHVMGSADHAAIMSPLPRQQPHPPIWVAAFGPKALTQAAKLGVPYLASPMEPLQQLQRNLQIYQDALAEYGSEQPREVAIMRTVFISDDRTRCQKIIEGLHALFPRDSKTEHQEPWIVGSAEYVQEQISKYQECLGMNYLIAVRPRLKGIKRDWCEQSAHQLATLGAQ